MVSVTTRARYVRSSRSWATTQHLLRRRTYSRPSGGTGSAEGRRGDGKRDPLECGWLQPDARLLCRSRWGREKYLATGRRRREESACAGCCIRGMAFGFAAGSRHSIIASCWPEITASPTSTNIRTTRPAFGDFSSFCIFIASITITPCWLSTSSPSAQCQSNHVTRHGRLYREGPAVWRRLLRRAQSERGSSTRKGMRSWPTYIAGSLGVLVRRQR